MSSMAGWLVPNRCVFSAAMPRLRASTCRATARRARPFVASHHLHTASTSSLCDNQCSAHVVVRSNHSPSDEAASRLHRLCHRNNDGALCDGDTSASIPCGTVSYAVAAVIFCVLTSDPCRQPSWQATAGTCIATHAHAMGHHSSALM